MKRFHALEWEDLKWFPNEWRDYGTDYLSFIATKFDIYKSILPIIREGILKSKNQEWVDCASGGGGGLINLANKLKDEFPELKIILTDYYPNVKAFEKTKKTLPEIFEYENNQIDAKSIPKHLQGKFRTIFAGFHHFKPFDAQKILQNAVDTNSPIAIFEPVGKNSVSFFSMLFVIFNVLLFTLFIRPVRWKVLPFIYLIPIIPLYILWDGIASILRTYSQEELNEIIKKLNNNSQFVWRVDKTEGAMPIYYLFGYPKKNEFN